MLSTNSIKVTIFVLLILITFMNVGLIAYPFELQAESTTVLKNSKASDINGNKTVSPHGANLSATLPLLVIFPEGSQISPFGFSTDAKGKLQIEILFNKPVDISTFVPGTSNILAMETNPNATVTVKWDLNNRFLTIVTNDLLNSLCTFDPDCNFALRLDGTEPNPIRATDGSLLNGGFVDYWTGFVIVG
ncbi:MAG: hypothetical protein QOK60_05135 [Nitrososphaeraceae archaeon]|nr:hypothetical protein [Nitrososphaeraceae archaeon]